MAGPAFLRGAAVASETERGARVLFPETSRAWRAMGTLLEVRIPDLPPAAARDAIRRVRRRVEEIEAELTLYRPESPLVALNEAPPGSWLALPPLLGEALATACAGWEETGGAFDPTVAPAMRAHGLFHLEGERADSRLLRGWRSRPGLEAIEIQGAASRVRRLDPRIEIDLGGLGKGIGVDAALDELAGAGSQAALVNLGGSIGVLGAPAGTPGWRIGLAHPRRPGALWTEFPLARGHLATSGDSERWVDTPAGRKHHLLDPRSGEPAPGVASLTVWSASGTAADLASTARFIEISRGDRPGSEAFLALREEGGALRGAAGRAWAFGGADTSSSLPKKT
jgi:thiamine biosynthesis lipoprotein